LKALAPKNIPPISVTLPVFHPPKGWLKALAPLNIPFIRVTLPVFHPPKGWLKALAPLNIRSILVTPLVSHWLISEQLKLDLPVKKSARFGPIGN